MAHLRPVLCPQSKREKLPFELQFWVLSALSPPERASCLIHKRRKKRREESTLESRDGEKERGAVLLNSEPLTLKGLWFLLPSVLRGTEKPVKERIRLAVWSSCIRIKHSMEVDACTQGPWRQSSKTPHTGLSWAQYRLLQA